MKEWAKKFFGINWILRQFGQMALYTKEFAGRYVDMDLAIKAWREDNNILLQSRIRKRFKSNKQGVTIICYVRNTKFNKWLGYSNSTADEIIMDE